MSHVTHTQPQPLRVRLPLWITLAAVALTAGAATMLFFVVSADDEATQAPKTAVPGAAAGVRYDGGPEEGTADLTPSIALRDDGGAEEGTADLTPHQPPAGVRYDSGPEEGTRGVGLGGALGARYDGGAEEGTAALTQRSAPATFDPNSIKSPPGVRYDGGPEEGTRGPLTEPQSPSTRYDGGPDEGSRGSGH